MTSEPQENNAKRIMKTLLRAVDEFNKESIPEQRLARSEGSSLYGGRGSLDSLGLVNLVVLAEQEIQREFGVTLVLADAKALSQKNSPFRTLRSLADHVANLLNAR